MLPSGRNSSTSRRKPELRSKLATRRSMDCRVHVRRIPGSDQKSGAGTGVRAQLLTGLHALHASSLPIDLKLRMVFARQGLQSMCCLLRVGSSVKQSHGSV
eukprot:3825270-Prymnesium_polylepis.2